IGRIRAFTKGWLERESNFLHMSYKYLLGVLKSGEYESFFEMAKSNLVYLMNPETYGRSTLENSSFIATSNNPNPKLFGQGFVSRLSGSTAEMLSMWHLLMFGKTLYHMENGDLALTLSTLLPKEYFMDGVITTTFHGVQVIYRNPEQKDGYTLRPIAYELVDASGKRDVVHGKSITGELAKAVRNKTITHITVHLAS
ncbi:MAG: hypothetical protein PHP32_07470, partial [Candidatus Izemoplasmatales bacterium]|nr:hypothetical protein [Candidatus Izemoplasmatales bacterium]